MPLVRDFRTYLLRFRSVSATNCWEWTALRNKDGYGRVQYNRVKWLVHRLSWKLWKSEIPDGMNVLHTCDNPACFNPDHLYLGTQANNMRDMMERGRDNRANTPRGEAHGRSKLTADIVIALRATLGTCATVGAQFGVCPMTVSLIRRRKLWGHLAA